MHLVLDTAYTIIKLVWVVIGTDAVGHASSEHHSGLSKKLIKLYQL